MALLILGVGIAGLVMLLRGRRRLGAGLLLLAVVLVGAAIAIVDGGTLTNGGMHIVQSR